MKKNQIVKICLHCKKEFSVPKSWENRKYCSKNCKINAHRVIKKCVICGKEFSITKHYDSVGKGKVCSRECFKEEIRIKQNELIKCGKHSFLNSNNRQRKSFSKRSNLEYRLYDSLCLKGISPKVQYKIAKGKDITGKIRYYFLDLAFPELQLNIECDGEYWHSKPERVESDKIRDAFLRENGWKIIRYRNQFIIDNYDEVIAEIINTHDCMSGLNGWVKEDM